MSELSRKKATIRRAQSLALTAYLTLDKESLSTLSEHYEDSLTEILAVLAFHADSLGIIRLQNLQALRRDVESVIDSLSRLQTSLLNSSIEQGAEIGTRAFQSQKTIESALDISQRTTHYVQQFTGADGLQLSDRIWIINDSNKTAITRAINSAVIQGNSASEAVAQLLANGETPPTQMQNKVQNASEREIGKVLKAQSKDPDAAYWQARRLFRTEINRAYGMAYQNSLVDDDDVVGTRFMLSPNHPRVDICDMHATVNRYGLGRGVYPKGKSPWPAHPNTLSYEEAVFIDEVTDEDRAGKEDRINWLSNQPGNVRVGILGVYKSNLLKNGVLKETMINSKVRALKKRFG
ncbi:hypothetical protein [Alteromonas sp. C1M14]|uniref:hypothetical protein n=1 Tax=Alteromonas sp. C1M14 TaxID=2841567 RepID=UPI001C08E282|nr:hypothetical protein [Alteromonas sp. C1M14]MBU2979014.1 hypothetical protein [Alteromonas sp. C1M14]